MSIFLSCGEPSGDGLVSALARALVDNGYDRSIWGMGGPLSVNAGVDCRWSSAELQIMGITEAMKAMPRLSRLADSIVGEICAEGPEAVVVADSPDFHIPLARRLRKRGYGGKIVFISPPTVWAWRKGRVAHLRELFDLCLPLFGFENRCLLNHGVRSGWIGHPMVESFPESIPRRGDGSVAILPGSRESEIKRLLPVLIVLAKEFKREGRNAVFSVARGLSDPLKRGLKRSLAGFDTFDGDARDLLSMSDIAVGASGTVAVEAMMSDRFMVVIYRAGALEWFVYSRFVSLPFVSIPNIMAGRKVYPELLQDRCTCENIRGVIGKYESDESLRDLTHRDLFRCRSSMGLPGAPDFWARQILSL